jgi:16S rRNA (guanine527-N7)-methyltransferase
MALPASAPKTYEAAILGLMPRLETTALSGLGAYLRLVDEYSPVLNITGYRGPDELSQEYVYIAAQLSTMRPLAECGRCADLGSGAGCPVVALAILHPGWSFTAIESRQRRSAFLELVKARLRLSNLRVLCSRTEQVIQQESRGFDLVTARAYARPAVLMEHSSALLKQGGELRAIIGGDEGELEQAARNRDLSIALQSSIELESRQWRLMMARRI